MLQPAGSVASRCAAFGVRWYSSNPVGPPGFCLDIDGVLKRGQQVLPAALEAMKQVQQQCSATVLHFTHAAFGAEGHREKTNASPRMLRLNWHHNHSSSSSGSSSAVAAAVGVQD